LNSFLLGRDSITRARIKSVMMEKKNGKSNVGRVHSNKGTPCWFTDPPPERRKKGATTGLIRDKRGAKEGLLAMLTPATQEGKGLIDKWQN